MSTDRKSAKRSPCGKLTVALAVCLGFVSHASAEAPKRLPAAFTSLTSYDVADRSESAARMAGDLIAADAEVGPTRKPLYARYRGAKLVSFRREVELLKEDVIFKVQSPGKRKSLMMVELKF